MIKLLSVSTMVLLLSGCFYQTIDGVEIDKAVNVCNNMNSKVWYVKESASTETIVKCTNGERINLDSYKGE